MISFMLGLSSTTTGKVPDLTAGSNALCRRSDVVTSQCYDLPGGRMLLAGQAPNTLSIGRTWSLLRAPLRVETTPSSKRVDLEALGARIQDMPPQHVGTHVIRALQKAEEEAVFVLWSSHHAQCLAFRSPQGRVPLYLFESSHGWRLTNTRRALLPYATTPQRDLRILASLLTTGAPPTNRDGTVDGCIRIPPGEWVTLSPNVPPRWNTWWRWHEPPPVWMSTDDAAAGYRDVLQHAIARIPTNDSVVLELSGGMDSSSLAAAWRTAHPQQSVHVMNIATDADDPDRILAHALATQWHWPFHAQRPFDGMDDRDMPDGFTGGGYAAHYAALTDIEGAKHVLSGHGGDALFRMTRWDIDRMQRDFSIPQCAQAIAMHRRAHGKMPPLFLRGRLHGTTGRRPVDQYRHPWLREPLRTYVEQAYNDAIRADDTISSRAEMCVHPRWIRLFEMGDPGYHGTPIQTHFPLFDLPVLRFVAQLPALPFLYNKHLARIAWNGTLPPAITARPKAVVQRTEAHLPHRRALLERGVGSVWPDWLDGDIFTRFLDDPTRYPRWTYLVAEAVAAYCLHARQ